jgi:hypothetical protein
LQTKTSSPIWMLYRRRIASQISYWLVVLGYNVRDRSITNRIYLVYFCGFWLIWLLAMFFLIGYSLAGLQDSISDISLSQLSLSGYTYLMAAWGIIQLWRVTRRSPFAFSEDDAFLLCRTPVNRRELGMVSFLLEWVKTSLPFAAVAISISFALAELHPLQSLLIFRFMGTVGAALRSLGIILPLQMAIQAFIWSLGAIRLQRDRSKVYQKPFWLKLLSPLFLFLLAVSVFFPSLNRLLLQPLTFPLEAALGIGISGNSWTVGFGVSLLYLLVGILAFFFMSGKIHLGQAAEETRLSVAVRQARVFFSFDLADALQQRERQVATHKPARFPARPGIWVLVWKDVVQSFRSMRTGLLLKWVVLFGMNLAMVFSTSWGLQLLAGSFWAINMGNLASQRLRNDLARWWIMRSLPFSGAGILKAEIGLSSLVGILISWLALAICSRPILVCILTGATFIFMAINSALATAQDILRRSETRILLSPSLGEENVPQQSVEGIIRTVILNLIPLGGLVWSLADPKQVFPALAALAVAGVITLFSLHNVPSAYKWIE